MARSQSAILSVDARRAVREEKKGLAVQLREAKKELREATRATKAAQRVVDKLETQLDKAQVRLANDKEARAAA